MKIKCYMSSIRINLININNMLQHTASNKKSIPMLCVLFIGIISSIFRTFKYSKLLGKTTLDFDFLLMIKLWCYSCIVTHTIKSDIFQFIGICLQAILKPSMNTDSIVYCWQNSYFRLYLHYLHFFISYMYALLHLSTAAVPSDVVWIIYHTRKFIMLGKILFLVHFLINCKTSGFIFTVQVEKHRWIAR